jgi:ribosome maturation factor RimP
METVEQIWKVVEPYLAAEHLELDDLELVGRGPVRTLRVTVDREGGVDLDRLAEVSRGLSRLLDAETDLPGPYQLEVSSPGLERKLTRPHHYRKSIGREVVVKTGSQRMRGVIVAASDQDFTIEMAESGERQPIRHDDVSSARTVFRWERAPKPGTRAK